MRVAVALAWTQFGWWSFAAPSAADETPMWAAALALRIQTALIFSMIVLMALATTANVALANVAQTQVLGAFVGLGTLVLLFLGATRLLTVFVRIRRFADRLAAPVLAFDARLLLTVAVIVMVVAVVSTVIASYSASGSDDVMHVIMIGGILGPLLLEAILLIRLRQILRSRLTARDMA